LANSYVTDCAETSADSNTDGLYKNAKVFVTGASGLVGLQFIKHLNACHISVVAAVRATTKTGPLLAEVARSSGCLQIVTTELGDEAGLAVAMSGCNIVVHAAATIDPNGQGKELREVNVEGTRHVLNAAIKCGVRHFIHISSLSVITGEDDQFKVTEDEPLRRCREPYANSKIDAEEIVMTQANQDTINVTALRPGFIYGPNEQAWMPRLVDALKKRRALIIGDGSKETNVIYVENLCRAIRLAMLNPVAYGQVYNLTDGEKITKKELFDAIADGSGAPRASLHVSESIARLLCEISSTLAPYAPPIMQPFLARYSRPAFRLAAVNQGFDIAKAERELKYVQRIPFREGMSRTLSAWK
jgi:nucleoside-diphosphate-sugar epimerase